MSVDGGNEVALVAQGKVTKGRLWLCDGGVEVSGRCIGPKFN